MRILLVSHYALPHIGGIEMMVDGLAKQLVARGHEVTHLAARYPGIGVETDDEPPYRRLAVPASVALEHRFEVPYPLFAPSLLSTLRREISYADVVHGYGFLYMSTVAALGLARVARAGQCPARVLTEQPGHVHYERRALDDLQRFAILTLGRLSLKAAQTTVVVNRRVEDEIHRIDRTARTVLIRNGIDMAVYRPPHQDERLRLRSALGWDERPRALFVGRLVARKGLTVALDAARAGAGAFELVVAGPGQPPKGTGRDVRFLGPQSPLRVAELYRAADVLLLPSHGEGFPVCAQEALASGLPVILGDDPGFSDYIDPEGRAVRLVEREPRAVLDAVLSLGSSGEAHDDIRGIAVRHAQRSFSWQQAASAHEELYRELRSSYAARHPIAA
jgi:glycosyltransferase involved in cell wall biosynthesis